MYRLLVLVCALPGFAQTVNGVAINKVLAEFAYAASAPCEYSASFPHEKKVALPRPRNFEVGKCYLFHVSAKDIAPNKYLEKRLVEAGATIISAPNHPSDFTYPISGGPRFMIKFKHGRNVGEINWTNHNSSNNKDVCKIGGDAVVLRYVK